SRFELCRYLSETFDFAASFFRVSSVRALARRTRSPSSFRYSTSLEKACSFFDSRLRLVVWFAALPGEFRTSCTMDPFAMTYMHYNTFRSESHIQSLQLPICGSAPPCFFI